MDRIPEQSLRGFPSLGLNPQAAPFNNPLEDFIGNIFESNELQKPLGKRAPEKLWGPSNNSHIGSSNGNRVGTSIWGKSQPGNVHLSPKDQPVNHHLARTPVRAPPQRLSPKQSHQPISNNVLNTPPHGSSRHRPPHVSPGPRSKSRIPMNNMSMHSTISSSTHPQRPSRSVPERYIMSTHENKHPTHDSADNTVVFVKGLKYTVNRKEIFNHFSKCGNILDIELPMCRRRRGRSRGICWITFERASNVDGALTLDGSTFQDREIRVFLAKSARAQNRTDGNRTTLFVWGLPSNIGELDLAKKETTRTQLEAMFLFAGEIKSIRIPKPSIRGPIAFVEFYEPDDALYGLCLDGRTFHGSTIRVEFARNAR